MPYVFGLKRWPKGMACDTESCAHPPVRNVNLSVSQNNGVLQPFHTWLHNNVNETTFWSHFQINKSPGDGHCFVHSVINYNSVCHGLGNLQYGNF